MRALLADLLHYWRMRNRRKHWTIEHQREHLICLLQVDHRWLASNPVADALTERYLAALSPHWFQQNFEDIRSLRERLGLDPHRRSKAAAGHQPEARGTGSTEQPAPAPTEQVPSTSTGERT